MSVARFAHKYYVKNLHHHFNYFTPFSPSAYLFLPFIRLRPPATPRQTDQITVTDPAVSKAYYGTLTGSPHTYTIVTAVPLKLYVGILMPYARKF
jgi:hypothetical protein